VFCYCLHFELFSYPISSAVTFASFNFSSIDFSEKARITMVRTTEVSLMVTVPDDINPGDEFDFEYRGTYHTIVCPDDAQPGSSVIVNLEVTDDPGIQYEESFNFFPSVAAGLSERLLQFPSSSNLQDQEDEQSSTRLGRLTNSSSNGSSSILRYYSTAQAVVPEGANPGDRFTVSYEDTTYVLRVPEGCEPGDVIYVDLTTVPMASTSTLLQPNESTHFLEGGRITLPGREQDVNRSAFWSDIYFDLQESFHSAPSRFIWLILFVCIVFVSTASFGVAIVLVQRRNNLFTAEIGLAFESQGVGPFDQVLIPESRVSYSDLEVFPPGKKDEAVIPFQCCNSSTIFQWRMRGAPEGLFYEASRDDACAAFEAQKNGLSTNITLSGPGVSIPNATFDSASGIEVCGFCARQDDFYDLGGPACLAKVEVFADNNFRLGIGLTLLLCPVIYLYVKIQILGMKIDTEWERERVKNEFKCCMGYVGVHSMQEVARALTANVFLIGFTVIELAPDGTIFYRGDTDYILQLSISILVFLGLACIVFVSFESTTWIPFAIVVPFHMLYKFVSLNYCFNQPSCANIHYDGLYALHRDAPEGSHPKRKRRDKIVDMILLCCFCLAVFSLGKTAVDIIEADALFAFSDFGAFMESFAEAFLGINVGALTVGFGIGGDAAVVSSFSVGAVLVLAFTFLQSAVGVITVLYVVLDQKSAAVEKVKIAVETIEDAVEDMAEAAEDLVESAQRNISI